MNKDVWEKIIKMCAFLIGTSGQNLAKWTKNKNEKIHYIHTWWLTDSSHKKTDYYKEVNARHYLRLLLIKVFQLFLGFLGDLVGLSCRALANTLLKSSGWRIISVRCSGLWSSEFGNLFKSSIRSSESSRGLKCDVEDSISNTNLRVHLRPQFTYFACKNLQNELC